MPSKTLHHPTPQHSRSLIQHWLHRTQPIPADQWELGWGNIFVLPTRAGWGMLLVLLVLLLASVNYQLSLGYLLTFLLAGSIAASVALAHANLRGLRLQALAPNAAFAGSTVQLHIRVQAPAGTDRHALQIAARADNAEEAWFHTQVNANAESIVELGYLAAKRGHHALPRITIQTLYPLGAFRLWSYWTPASHVWVYPAPEVPTPPLAHAEVSDAGQGIQTAPRSMTEPDGVRAYQRGDPLRHIVWKKAAQALSTGSEQLVSRSFAQATAPDALWLTEAATGLPQREARLSRLCAWLLDAKQQQRTCGLHLHGGVHIPPASSAEHYEQCLQALASAQGDSQHTAQEAL